MAVALNLARRQKSVKMISLLQVAATFPRLTLCALQGLRNVSTYNNPLYFRATDALCGEPLKKRKRIDPAIVRHREERKKRKLEKQIRRLEKFSRQLKPISEAEVPSKLIDECKQRTRSLSPISVEELERRALLTKEWTRYKSRQWMSDVRFMDALVFSQQKALDELKAESKDLYDEAVQIDMFFLPHSAIGPTCTLPIDDYDSPDGDYVDTTRKYEGET